MDWNSGYVSTAPHSKFAVSMFSDDHGMYTGRIHLQMFTEQIAKPCGIQHRSTSDYPLLRITGNFPCRIRQNIHRIADDQQNPLEILRCDLRNDSFQYLYIFVHQCHAAFSGFLCCTCRNDNEPAVSHIRIISRIDLHHMRKWPSMGDICCLAMCFFLICIDQHQLRKKSFLHQCKCCGRSHKSTADDRCFLSVHSRFLQIRIKYMFILSGN